MHVIHETAQIGRGCSVGYFTVIGAGVVLGAEVSVGSGVTVYPGTKVGAGTCIGDNVVLGRPPRPGPTSTVVLKPECPPLTIGEGGIIGTGAVLYSGSTIGRQVMVADLASVREGCRLGDFVLIGRGVALENQVTVGDYTKVQTGAYLTAFTTVEDHVLIGPMVTTTNDNSLGRGRMERGPILRRGTRVGGGAIILPGVELAPETFVAAGALVSKDTRAGTLYLGLPARERRAVTPEELLPD